MKVETTYEKISPAQALEMLKKSEGNRAMKSDHIASLADQMKRGEWVLNGSSIVFANTGRLLDGHHRLMAIHISGCTVLMQVVRGVESGAVFTIDGGVSRGLADHLTLNGGTNTHTRASYLANCVRLLVGQNVALKTIDAYRTWEPVFHEGTEAFFLLELKQKKHLYVAKVAAPLIIAFKAEPMEMPGFFVGLRDGTDMRPGSPVHTLREYLLQQRNADRVVRESAEALASKIFAATLAHLEGRSLKKLQASTEAMDHFRKLYSRGTAAKLISSAKDTKNKARQFVGSFVPGESKNEKAA